MGADHRQPVETDERSHEAAEAEPRSGVTLETTPMPLRLPALLRYIDFCGNGYGKRLVGPYCLLDADPGSVLGAS
ncbi:hypothetical protein [Methylorubrum extorquens]|uniref:hypothetical protein n=1 Tax=Methylorubrum extorquens TaxID=408 RepID=UPI00209CBDAC|nr:hypothetical protein [Methylorubrum extorquens]MCP1535695.1 hypothetical protein [Methylorubrum extorquens]